jgi:hypothetical protein
MYLPIYVLHKLKSHSECPECRITYKNHDYPLILPCLKHLTDKAYDTLEPLFINYTEKIKSVIYYDNFMNTHFLVAGEGGRGGEREREGELLCSFFFYSGLS